MDKLLCLGKDNVLHCCHTYDKKVSVCEGKISIKQVNPDLSKLQKAGISLIWCYECSYEYEDYIECLDD